MNYKVDYNFLEITNSPAIEYYFEKRAMEGWFIDRIYLGSIFIFKKTEPTELDFSIRPYELEDAGWNYVTESYDLHIYYKEYKAEAVSHGIEDAEEFKILEAIGQRRIQGNTLQVFLFLLLGWFNVSGIYTNPDFLKDGAAQLILPFILTGLTIAIWGVIHMKRFLKLNRENIKAGKDIEYSDSMFLVPSITFFFASILFILFIFHFLYMGIISRSLVPFIFILVVLILFGIERVYRFWKTSDKTAIDQKKMSWIGATLAVLIAMTGFGVYAEARIAKNPNLEEYKVLTTDTFDEGELESEIESTFWHDFSLIIPKSYNYSYYISEEDEYVETEYSQALVTDFANDLVKRYIDKKKTNYGNFYVEEVKLYFEEGFFDDSLKIVGINEGDLIRLKGLKQEDAEEITHQLIDERSITQADADLWNADEVYFLSYDKDEILIRSGRKVFYLSGKDFTDATVIEKTKERLALN